MDVIVGIDLGTTNSEVAYLRDGQPHVFAGEHGDPILPSFVGLSEDGRLLVGKPARNQWVVAPERTVKSIKRKMGQDVKVTLGDQEYRPQEISAMILRALRDRAARELGGDDFDDLLLKHVADRFQTEHGVDLRANLVARARLLRAVEAAKRHLSYHPYGRIEEEFIAEKEGQALHLNTEISREEYEELIRPLLDRTMDCDQRALDDSRLTGSTIDKVVLVGGSTRTPMVSRMLEERLSQPTHQ